MADGEGPAKATSHWQRYRLPIYFLVGLAVVDLSIAWHDDHLSSFDPDNYAERLQNCQRQPWDLVLVGGSPVSEGVDPALLSGIRWHDERFDQVFNLGLPGATTTDIWHAVRHGLVNPPRLLIYGITASDLNDSRLEPHGVHSLMDSGDLNDWLRERPLSGLWAAKHYAQSRLSQCWQLYRHRNAIRLWATDRAEQFIPGAFPAAATEARANRQSWADLRRGDGFAPEPVHQQRDFSELKKVGLADQVSFTFLKDYRLGEHLHCLHRLLDWAEAAGVPVILVDMPVTADLEEGRHPEAFRQYREVLATLERERQLKVLRAARSAVGLNDRHFADLIHLNASGSQRFTRWLRSALQDADETTPFTARHSDAERK